MAIILGCLVFALMINVAQAAGPLFVSNSGNDANDCLSSGTACATIQAAIGKASAGDTINIASGNYTENIVIDKSLTLAGAGASSTTIVPAISAPAPCSGGSLCGGAASNIILVQADDVTIHDMTLDGDNPALTGGIDIAGANIDARNGVIKNTTLTFNGLDVYNTTVKNIYLRGIYSTGGSFNFHGNIVTNVQGDPYGSIAMFAWYGPGIMANNTVSYATDAISANHSNGIQFLNNTVTNSQSGVHTDNAGDAGGAADLIQGNNVSNCTPGGYGVWTFVPYIAPTVDHNTVTNCNVGLSAWAGSFSGPTVTTSFTNNTATGKPGDTGSVGAYITTDSIGWGYTDVAVDFTCNVITGFETGVYLTADEMPAWNPGPYAEKTITANFSKNEISGNTVAGMDKGTAGGTINITAANNWWGSSTGPYNAITNPAGTGNSIANGIAYTPWLNGSYCAKPDLKLSTEYAYWANPTDYANGRLSLKLTVTNNGASPAYNVILTGNSTITNNVTQGLTGWPIGLGDITINGESVTTPVDYDVSAMTGGSIFYASITGSAYDACGNFWTYP